jgi:HD-GYP domain-containing protein (c-di-GMP phosphodiesterase class II)
MATDQPGTPTPDDDETLQAEARELITRLFVTIKLAFVFDAGNEALRVPCERLAAAVNRGRERGDGTAALQFLSDGVYANRTLVKVDAATIEQAQYLYGIWSGLGIGEIATVAETSPEDWLGFVATFQKAVGPGGNPVRLRDSTGDKIRLREIQASGTSASGILVTERFRALRAYGVVAVTLREQVDRMLAGKRLQPAKIKRSVQEVVSLAVPCASLFMSLLLLKRHKRDLPHHLANCTVLSVILGARLGLKAVEQVDLAVQAALHDIGGALLPEELARDDGPARRDVAAATVRRLAATGTTAQVRSRLAVAAEVVRAIEPEGTSDGLPAPAGASRIVALAHAFDRLTSPRPDRPALAPDEALRVLAGHAGRAVDQDALRILIDVVGVWPVGSLVALSSGEIALVVETAAGGGARPRIKIVRDPSGVVVDGAVVDLAGEPAGARAILRCVDEEAEDLNPVAFLLG